ncbi:MAG: T9SS type A sorting domain-containing protein [Bacteroidetes bacterium]|nr:T9SS type A sorting domain-containing protein [Bacteroidota bacterium]
MVFSGLPIAYCLLPVNMYSQDSVPKDRQESEPATLCEQYGSFSCTISLSNVSSSQLGVVGYTSEVVCITGVFTVDTPDFTFDDCIIKMSPGASIEVNQGKHFYLLNSKVFSCEEMWKEIHCKVDARLYVKDSHIEDGQYALHTTSIDELWCESNILNRNHVGLLIDVKPGAQTPPNSLFAIYGNYFGCELPLNAPFSGQTPLPASNSFAGIWVKDNAGIGIGNPAESSNTFKKQMIGILSERTTNLWIRNSSFDEMLYLTTNEGFSHTGVGVLALEDSFVRQVGFGMGETDPISFKNCENVAIRVENATILTKDNRITGVHEGAILCDDPNMNISRVDFNRIESNSNNLLSNSVALIDIEKSSSGNDFIRNNIIDFEHHAFTGINFYDHSVSTGTATISNNMLYMNNDYDGYGMDIHLNAGNNVWVNNNLLDLIGVSTGINWYVSQGQNYHLYSNSLVGSDSGYGIRFYLGEETMICQNTIEGFNTGMEFSYSSMDSEVGLNEFSNQITGFLLSTDGINLGIQYWKGNSWSGTFSNYAADCTGSDCDNSQFIVNDDLSCNPDYWPNSGGVSSVDPPIGWFIYNSGGCVESCELEPLTKNNGSDTLSVLEYSMIDGTYDASNQSAPAIWDNHRFLYKKIISTGLATDSDDPILLDWIADQQNSLTGDFFVVNEIIRDAYSAENAHVASVLVLNEEIESLMDELETAQSDWMSDPTNQDLVSQYEQLLISAREKKAQRDSLISLADSFANNQLEDALAFVSSLDCTELHEQYFQRVLEIRIQHLLGEAITDEIQNELEVIASQCYDLGGTAVLLAPRLMEGPVMYEFLEPADCVDGIFMPESTSKKETFDLLKAYPNPVTESFTLVFSEKTPFTGEVLLLDATGVLLQYQQLESSSETTFDLSAQPAGVYLVKAIPLSGESHVLKVFKQ